MSIAKPFVFCSQHNQHQSDHWATICDCEFLKWALSHLRANYLTSRIKQLATFWACQQFWSSSLVFLARDGSGTQEWAKIVFWPKKDFFVKKLQFHSIWSWSLWDCLEQCHHATGDYATAGLIAPLLNTAGKSVVFRVFFYEINKAGLGTLSTTYIFIHTVNVWP